MARTKSYHGGLQFEGDTEGAIERFGSIVAATLDDYGHLVERKALLSDTEATIVSSQYLVRLTIECEAVAADDRFERLNRAAGLKTMTRPIVANLRNRLVITVSPASPLLDDREVSELMLVVILYRMVDICSTQRVEWLSPSTVLTIEQFLSAFDTLAPSKPRNRKQIFQSVTGQFAGLTTSEAPDPAVQQSEDGMPAARPIQLTDDQLLSIAFRSDVADELIVEEEKSEDEDDRPSDAMRLSCWCLTGVVASISAPIAVSMAAVNLIRGEDFRLNTQVLVFTFAIVSLNASNAFADVAHAIGM